MNLGHVCDETWSYSTLISPINFGMLPLRPPFRFILTHWIQCTLLLLGRLFCFIFAVVITILGPKQLRRKGFVSVHSFRFQSVVVGKSRQALQTSHPRAREQWLWACALANLCSSGCLHSFRILCLGNGTTHSELGLPRSITLIKIIPHRHGQTNADSPSLRLS